MYTGIITIRDDNVFDLFEAFHFLQMRGTDPLMQKCIHFMTCMLESSVNLQSSVVVKVSQRWVTYYLKFQRKSFVDVALERIL